MLCVEEKTKNNTPGTGFAYWRGKSPGFRAKQALEGDCQNGGVRHWNTYKTSDLYLSGVFLGSQSAGA
jgi:hypothetical protein